MCMMWVSERIPQTERLEEKWAKIWECIQITILLEGKAIQEWDQGGIVRKEGRIRDKLSCPEVPGLHLHLCFSTCFKCCPHLR